MAFDVATVQFLVMVGGFVITVSVFLFTRMKEAENRGRLMQRVDTLEKVLDAITNRTTTVENDVACHDADLSKITTEIDGLKELIEKMDKKLDRLVERREAVRP
jgi:archaellum component FlaC